MANTPLDVTPVQVWQTSDGQRFDSLSKATEHVQKHNLALQFFALHPEHANHGLPVQAVEAFVTWLMEQYEVKDKPA